MKVSVYRHIDRIGGIRVLQVEHLDLSYEEVKRHDPVPLEQVDLAHWGGLGPVDTGVHEGHWGLSPGRFRIRSGGGTREVYGCLSYESLTEMMSFLQESYVPDGTSKLDTLVRQYQDGGGAPVRAALEEVVGEGRHDMGRLPRLTQVRRMRMRTADAGTVHRPPHVLQAPLEEWTKKINHSGAEYLTINPSHAVPMIIALEKDLPVRGGSIPRLEYYFHIAVRHCGMRRSRGGSLWYDGKTARLVQNFRSIRGAARSLLERDGALLRSGSAELIPPAHLRARAAIRLPGREEAERLLSAKSLERKTRYRAFRTPGYVRDSRSPVPLAKGMRLIDVPEAAVHLLARTTDGIYIPDDPPACPEPESIPEKATCLLLCNAVVKP